MLKNFENWLLENKYSALTATDYAGRIERLCRVEKFTLAHLVENISSILPQYETAGEKSSYGIELRFPLALIKKFLNSIFFAYF